MGKQSFRLSHMIPNAWFYRLRDMNTRKPLPSAYASTTKNSFCYTPRYYTSPTPTSNTNTINNPALSIYTPLADELTQDLFLSPTTLSSYYESPFSESTRSCSCGVVNSSTAEVVTELNEKSYTKRIQDSSGYYDLIQEIELQKPPPILTKSKNKDTLTTVEKKEETSSTQSSISIKIVKESISKKQRKPVSGVKISSNSTRTAVCKRNIIDASNDHKRQKNSQNNLSSSCCIVKSSIDPQKDFKESMMEMIVEDNIKDFENLLASYLSLNSNEYHDMIIKAFEEIWSTFEFVE